MATLLPSTLPVNFHRFMHTSEITTSFRPSARALLESTFPNDFDDDDDDDDDATFFQNVVGLHDERDCIWIVALAPQEGEVVGLVTGARYHDSLYLFNLCVSTRLQGQGVGTQLIFELNDVAFGLGIPFITGSVLRTNISSLRIYVHLGAVACEAGLSSDDSSPHRMVRVRAPVVDPAGKQKLVDAALERRGGKSSSLMWGVALGVGVALVLLWDLCGIGATTRESSK
eukprot:gnl/Spiro4/12490_TR6598_c1_g1_i1.p1 gnl/Spiro4/12490_TR6598_c1_g1~~gnl/Spiro4/12490_TR6598_c1_g1_i1.p1  ORF type:complete len:228 (-),score=19.50 gnl/Spiro4/12490_TR6598_c1_g1_i1:49-732(-)